MIFYFHHVYFHMYNLHTFSFSFGCNNIAYSIFTFDRELHSNIYSIPNSVFGFFFFLVMFALHGCSMGIGPTGSNGRCCVFSLFNFFSSFIFHKNRSFKLSDEHKRRKKENVHKWSMVPWHIHLLGQLVY